MTKRYNLGLDPKIRELMKVLASAVGSPSSLQKLANTFNSQGPENISRTTVGTYIEYLLQCFFIEKAECWDVKGRRHINSPAKYYFSDLGLRNALLGFGELGQIEPHHLMENVVYNELRARDFDVKGGRVQGQEDGVRKTLEIDFVAGNPANTRYIQCAWSMPDQAKMDQELRSLRAVKDNFRKIVITADPIKSYITPEGIQILSLRDFLLQPNALD